MRSLKVYGWQGWRRECPPAANGDHSTREVAAVPSIAALIRLTGETRAGLFNLNETGNDVECRLALARPGVVFWRPLDERGNTYREAAP